MKRTHLHVYYRKQLIVIETNLEWALPYWQLRKQRDKTVEVLI